MLSDLRLKWHPSGRTDPMPSDPEETFREFRTEWRANSRQSLHKLESCPAPWTSEVERVRLELQRCIQAIKPQFKEDARKWGSSPTNEHLAKKKRGFARHLQVRAPPAYFEEFVGQVVNVLHDFFVSRTEEQVRELQHRVNEEMEGYLKEVATYADRSNSSTSALSVWKRRTEEELYIYEPLKFWDKDQQEVMKDIIKSRLLILQGLDFSSVAERDEPVEDWQAELELERQRLEEEEEIWLQAMQLDREKRAKEYATKRKLAMEEAKAAAAAAEAAAREYAQKEQALKVAEETEMVRLQSQLQDAQTSIEDTAAECEKLRQEIEELEKEARSTRNQTQALKEQAAGDNREAAELEERAKAMLEAWAEKMELEEGHGQDPSKVVLEPADQAKLKHLIAELQVELKQKIFADKSALLGRIKWLEAEIARLKAVLAEPLPRQVEVEWQPFVRPTTRTIFRRLFKDASNRVVRSMRALDEVTQQRQQQQELALEAQRSLPSPRQSLVRTSMSYSYERCSRSVSSMPGASSSLLAEKSFKVRPQHAQHAQRSTNPEPSKYSQDKLTPSSYSQTKPLPFPRPVCLHRSTSSPEIRPARSPVAFDALGHQLRSRCSLVTGSKALCRGLEPDDVALACTNSHSAPIVDLSGAEASGASRVSLLKPDRWLIVSERFGKS